MTTPNWISQKASRIAARPERSRLVSGSTHRLHLPSLDGARGLAILMVLLDHFGSAKIIPFHECKGIGHMGVYLFFALSAFLLTVPMCRKLPATLLTAETWRVYFLRRFLRIYPLYAVVLITEHFMGIGTGWRGIAEHLLLRRGEGIFWSMEIEVKYYLALPLLVLTFLVAWRRSRTVGALSMVGLAAVLVTFCWIDQRWWSLDGHLLRVYLPVFLCGSAAGWLYTVISARSPSSAQVRYRWDAASIVSLAGVCITLPAIASRLPATLTLGSRGGVVVAGMMWAMFILSHLNGADMVRRALEWKPLRSIGMISYSLYLWHEPVIHCLWVSEHSDHAMPTTTWPLHAVLLFFATALAGCISYVLVEQPMSRIHARFTYKL
jgi:peptidoglycan/LPS O-acetylase OafA/YrhL